MKKNLFYVAALAAGLAFSATGCSSEDDPTENVDPENIDYTSENATSWQNYMKAVVTLLRTDATNLDKYWRDAYQGGQGYAVSFKTHTSPAPTSAVACVEQILDGCIDIANEVGETKIGDPYNKYVSGDTQAALYAVESWYSWHSREDYSNNIVSIANAFCGTRADVVESSELQKDLIADNSIYKALANHGQQSLADKTLTAIKTAYDAILAIPQPFRNHITSTQSLAAQDACAALKTILQDELKPIFNNNQATYEPVLGAVVTTYVDDVVLPTYDDLQEEVGVLYDKIDAIAASPSNATFKDACEQWIKARKPWEESEAFLFGPVADQGLDPNMDSWPLDQAAIVNILYSGDYSQMEWTGDYNEDSENISAAQNVRGFHTLEFLLFKDGEPRKVQE